MTQVPTQRASREIPLARPDITDLERRAVMRVLETPVLSIGPEIVGFEKELAAQAGVAHAVAVNSGTSALHLIMASLGIGPGDEVVTTPFSFVASSNCILFQGATPVFADIDPLTLALDPARVEERITPRTKAVLAVDVFGHPADWDALEALARRHGLALVEDSAESIGARYRGRPAGGFGDAAIFAFYPNKQITTGEGGAVVTDRQDIADLARSLRNQGRGAGAGWLHHERLGYNFRISEMNCALGRAQLSRLDEILAARERVAQTYNRVLANVPGVQTPFVADDVSMSWFVYVVRLAEGYTAAERDRVMDHLRANGIGCNNYFPCIHLEPFYRAGWGFQEGDFPIAESISGRCIALPFFGALTEEDIEHVAFRLDEALRGL
jgi:perosamine synthetase